MSVRCTGVYVCLLVIVSFVVADPVSFIKKCKPTDSKCHKESAQAALLVYAAGVPELGIDVLDPFVIDKLDASDSGLQLIVTNAKITGLRGCRVKKLTQDVEKSKLTARAQCDLTLDGKYKMKGMLFILPIEGDGNVHVKLNKISLTFEANMEQKPGKDGKSHWNIKSWSHTFELKEKSEVEFENLFPGNKLLGDTARDFIASNGNEIITSVGRPVVKSVIAKLIDNVNKFFATVPYEDLVDEE